MPKVEDDFFDPTLTNEDIVNEIDADNEKDFLRQLKKKNKDFLLKCDLLERERIAGYICERLDEVAEKHKDLEEKIDKNDEVFRMVRRTIPGDDGDLPNYTSPISTIAVEVIHADIMNTFHTPKDIGTVLPVEEGDIPKVKKLSTFMNWSTKHELDIFDKTDRLFHNSSKVGEAPYLMHWVKEYGTEIKREPVMNPANPSEPLYDPDTQEVLYQEVEEQKLLYNAPRLEIFSRKDYKQPTNALMDHKPEWESRKIRMSYNTYLQMELQGKFYKGSIDEIKEWENEHSEESNKDDYEGDEIPIGKWHEEFEEWYGTMRLQTIKADAEDETEDRQELEEEIIAIVHTSSETLCQLRINKFPMKERPIGIDYFMPDDEGRRAGRGVMDVMEAIQDGYDALYNQFIFGVAQANNPIIFTAATGNMRQEPLKVKAGFMYPVRDASATQIFRIPPPDASIGQVLELITQWSQLLFGISAFAAGVESTIDPDAPARKTALIVQQGNVRRNTIIKRKNKTLQDILRRWFLLYKANMPPNKYMRIVGESKDNPWKFDAVSILDFSVSAIPDFEIVGNVLNANKTLEANKALSVYQILIANPFFSPQTRNGLQALNSLTKWLIDKMDETGLSNFLPQAEGEVVNTPEEENARFLQGDQGEPTPQEDHVRHIQVHRDFINDPTIPEEIKVKIVLPHIQKHAEMLQQLITQQQVLGELGVPQAQGAQPPPQGVPNASQPNERSQAGVGPIPQGEAQTVFPGRGVV